MSYRFTYEVFFAGPICANVKDAALFYALLAGPSLDFELGLNQPRVKLPNFDGNLEGIKMAIDRRFFNASRGLLIFVKKNFNIFVTPGLCIALPNRFKFVFVAMLSLYFLTGLRW